MNKKQRKKLAEAIQAIYKLSAETNSGNLLHNYKWREILQIEEVSPFYKNIKSVPGLHGTDATSDNFESIESKSGTSRKLKTGLYSKSVSFEFDKQNDSIRRQQTLKYDSFIFSVIAQNTGRILITAIAQHPEAIKSINSILLKRQKEFLKELKKKEKQGKRIPRDSIRVELSELFGIKNLIWVKRGRKITIKKAKSLFKT